MCEIQKILGQCGWDGEDSFTIQRPRHNTAGVSQLPLQFTRFADIQYFLEFLVGGSLRATMVHSA